MIAPVPRDLRPYGTTLWPFHGEKRSLSPRPSVPTKRSPSAAARKGQGFGGGGSICRFAGDATTTCGMPGRPPAYASSDGRPLGCARLGKGGGEGGGEARGIRPLLPVTCILLFTFLSPKTLAFRSNAVSLTHSFILCLTFTSPPPCVCVFWAILRPFSCSFSKARS